MLLDVVVERLRTFDLAENRGARITGENVAREENHELVAPNDLARRVDGAEPVAVAVPRDADGRLRALDACDKSRKGGDDGRIRMVIRKPPVHVAVERIGLDTGFAHRRDAERAGRAVARVDAHRETAVR